MIQINARLNGLYKQSNNFPDVSHLLLRNSLGQFLKEIGIYVQRMAAFIIQYLVLKTSTDKSTQTLNSLINLIRLV